jgi:hypothetical protein
MWVLSPATNLTRFRSIPRCPGQELFKAAVRITHLGSLDRRHPGYRGSSTLDIRHRFVVTANYELPFGKSLTGAKKQFINGWQLNGIYVWSTGLKLLF